MINSKNFLLYGLLCLGACSSPKKETTDVADSTKTDSIASEVTAESNAEGGSTFDIDPTLSGQSLTIYGKSGPIIYWLNKIYRPDHWINLDTGAANYKIKSADLTEDEYGNKEGRCLKRSVLLVQREMPGEQYYDLHFLYEDADGNLSSEKVTFDGDIAQSTGSMSLSTDYKLSKDCPTLAVLSSSEGGDIETFISKEISFFIANEFGMTRVLDLTLEETKKEYRASPGDEEKSTSEVRDFEILSKKSNGLFDIKVHITNKKNEKVIEEKDTIFRFDGEKYSEQKN
jgi:hypothetical protein